MSHFSWRQQSLIERIRWLRYIMPPTLVLVVVIYQLGITQWLERNYGHGLHYGFEIAFYSLLGPAVSLLTLVWVEQRLREREQLERQVKAHTQQIASLTDVSADAILSLDSQGNVTSWNRGAERMLAYPESAMIGRSLNDLLPAVETPSSRLQEQDALQAYETMILSGDGRLLAVELTQTQLTKADEGSPASLIIMRDVTARREREAVRGEERVRIARDLHDGVAQTLYFMALKADSARQQLDQHPEQAAAELKEIGQITRQVIREVRRTIFALRPLDWTTEGFLQALRNFVLGFAEQVGWQAVIDIDDDRLVIPTSLEPTTFRLVQESLNNVAKHAQASRIQVKLFQDKPSRKVIIEVRDNGQGFEPAKVHEPGLGLQQMKSRVTSLGGNFRIESALGQGTKIAAQLPITRGHHE